LDLCGVCDNSTENDDTSCKVDSTDTAVPDAVLTMQVVGDADMVDIAASMAAAMDIPLEALEFHATDGSSTPVVLNRTAEVQLDIAIEDVSNTSARAAFVLRFRRDAASMLGIPEGRVEVTSIVGGSVIVGFTVGPASDGTIFGVDALRSALAPNTTLAGSSVDEIAVHPAAAVEMAFTIRSSILLDVGKVVSDVLVLLEDQISVDAIPGLAAGQSVFASLSMVCPAGYYGSSNGGCVRCPLGSEPNGAQDGCEQCQRLAVGDKQTWVSTNGGSCVLCPAGMAPNDARTACVTCEAGTFNDGSGKACARCSDATMVPTAASDGCVCPSGSAQFPIGTFDSSHVLLSCFESDFSEFDALDPTSVNPNRACLTCSDLPGPGLECVECAEGTSFALDGWALGKAGRERYVASIQLSENGSSLPQVVAAAGPNGTTTAGATAVPRNLFKCPYEGACLGEDPTNSSKLMRCKEGYTGILCAICQPQWHRSTEGCIQCTEQNTGNSWYGLVFTAIAAPLVLLWRLVIKPHLQMQAAGLPEGEGMQHVGLETKFKIVVSLFQVVGSFPFTLSLTYPAQFTTMLNYVRIIFLDIIELVRVDCLMQTSLYVNTGLAALLLPGLIVLLYIPPTLCLCTQSGRQAKREGTAYQSALNRSFFVIFMLYPYLSKTSFRAFACRDLDEGEKYHMDYYEVDCNSDEYILFRYFALGMLIAFPVGLPLLFFVLLYANREELKKVKTESSGMELLLGPQAKRSDDKEKKKDKESGGGGVDLQREADEAKASGLPPAVVKMLQKRASRAKAKKKRWWQGGSEKYSFLTRDYRPEFYYFECIELVRKMLLAGAIIFLSQGSIEQAFVAGIISFFFFAVYARAMPFRDRFDNVLKLCAEVQTFMTLFISIILRTASTQGGKLEKEEMYGMLLVGTNIIVTPVPLLFGILIPMGCNTCLYMTLCCRQSKRHTETAQVTPGKDKYKVGEGGEGAAGDGGDDRASVKRVLEFMTPDGDLEVEELDGVDSSAAGVGGKLPPAPEMTVEKAKELMATQEREKAELQNKLSDSERKAARLEKILEREKTKMAKMQQQQTAMGGRRSFGGEAAGAGAGAGKGASPATALNSESLVFDDSGEIEGVDRSGRGGSGALVPKLDLSGLTDSQQQRRAR
jgi:hypothetical protein